ncbi:MAG TPA: hypothetical protein VMS31_19325 [Pyrinomonadaceae bacterium]|nr:hypothetical protein [Pyrinomonadaceae bacterium]
MAEISKWLTHEDQKDLFELLFAATLNLLFLLLISPVLWMLGTPTLTLVLAQGYGLLWVGLLVSTALLKFAHRLFKVNIYDHANAFVISNLIVSCLWQAGWALFAASTVHNFRSGAPMGTVVLLYLIGLLSCLTAFLAVSSFFQGHIYKFVSLPVALLVFIIVSLTL